MMIADDQPIDVEILGPYKELGNVILVGNSKVKEVTLDDDEKAIIINDLVIRTNPYWWITKTFFDREPPKLKWFPKPENGLFIVTESTDEISNMKLKNLSTVPATAYLVSIHPPLWVQPIPDGILFTKGFFWYTETVDPFENSHFTYDGEYLRISLPQSFIRENIIPVLQARPPVGIWKIQDGKLYRPTGEPLVEEDDNCYKQNIIVPLETPREYKYPKHLFKLFPVGLENGRAHVPAWYLKELFGGCPK